MSVVSPPGAAVFLDRDGTLNVERHYLSRAEEFELLPGVEASLQRLRRAGFRLFVVTNQSGIGRGYFTPADLERIHDRMRELLGPHGVNFERIYVAPESPDQPSRYRKPSPQALLDARDEFGIDLGKSVMVGDKWVDVEAGRQAGCAASLLVRTGYGAETERREASRIHEAVVVKDLAAAADWILTNLSAPGIRP